MHTQNKLYAYMYVVIKKTKNMFLNFYNCLKCTGK